MLRVVMVNACYFPDEPGGAEKSVRTLARTLSGAGHEVLVVCTSENGNNGSDTDGRIRVERYQRPFAGPEWTWVPTLRSFAWHLKDRFNQSAASNFFETLTRFEPDVIHTNNLPGLSVSLWEAASRQEIPIVHTLRDYYLICPKTSMFRNDQNCAYERCRPCIWSTKRRMQATQDVGCVVGNSKFILEQHVNRGLFPGAEKRVVYNAFAEVGRHPVRTSTLKQDELIFGYLGRIHASKGVQELVAAFKVVQAEHPALRLKIAGTGETSYINELKTVAAGAPVDFAGFVEPTAFLKTIDYAVVPSLWAEPLARSSFEPQALGIPVVGARSGGTPEVIDDDQNGWLYDPDDTRALESCLLKAIFSRERYTSLSRCAVEKSLAFSEERLLAGYEEAFTATIENGHRQQLQRSP